MNATRVTAEDLVVTTGALPSLTELQSLWHTVEIASDCSFFLTWHWIGAWLQLIANRSEVRLVKVTRQSHVVAVGLFTSRRTWRGVGPVHLRLHETGDPALDNLTIEYNGLLSAAGLERPALAAAVRHLMHADQRWSTLDLPGVVTAQVPFEEWEPEFTALRVRRRQTHHVDLARLRGRDYLDELPPTTRSAIRRTIRRLDARFGEVSMTVADTPAERRDYLDELMRLHEIHWRSRGEDAGAFADGRVRAFHERLLVEDAGRGVIQLLRLSAGTQTVGYAYNFVHGGIVYYYQAGIDYPRFKDCGSPGLLLLSRAVAHAALSGHARFDFMAGDAKYKRDLASGQGELSWVSLDRAGVGSSMRSALRRLRTRLGGSPA